MEEFIGRIPPHSVEAEQSVIGAMIVNKEAINTALEMIRPDDFYKEANKEIYEAIKVLFNKNEPVDIITLSDNCFKTDRLYTVCDIFPGFIRYSPSPEPL